MPLYAYVCADCDIVIEERRAFELADWPPVECPVCHGLCEREIALVNLHFDRVESGPVGDADSMSLNLDEDERPHAVNVFHAPGCPCCNGRRRVS